MGDFVVAAVTLEHGSISGKAREQVEIEACTTLSLGDVPRAYRSAFSAAKTDVFMYADYTCIFFACSAPRTEVGARWVCAVQASAWNVNFVCFAVVFHFCSLDEKPVVGSESVINIFFV